MASGVRWLLGSWDMRINLILRTFFPRRGLSSLFVSLCLCLSPETMDKLGSDGTNNGLRIQTWALEEARRRLEIEGILEDPYPVLSSSESSSSAAEGEVEAEVEKGSQRGV